MAKKSLIYDIRTTVERKNLFEVVGYNRSKMLTRDIEAARMFATLGKITALLTALTAFKVQRNDLIRSQSALDNSNFKSLKIIFKEKNIKEI